MTRPLIGLLGSKGSGKSTVASILVDRYHYVEHTWATALKREIYDAFGADMLWCHYPDDSFDAWLNFVDKHKHAAPGDEYGWVRPLLQFWGTEYRRTLCDPDYWVRQLVPHLLPGVVVPDTRFPNEVAAIRAARGLIWRIDRPGYDGDGHASEQVWRDIVPDAVLVNNGTLDELARQVFILHQ